MRKSNSFLLAVLFAVSVHAEPISVDFKSATVVDVVQTLIREVLKRDYVISPDIVQADKRVTVSVKAVESENLLSLLDGVLHTVEVQIVERDGVLYIEKEQREDFSVPKPISVAQVGFNGVGQGLGLPDLGKPFRDDRKVPEEIDSYKPKGRTVEFLASVAKAAGADVMDTKGKADQLVFSGSKEAMEKARSIIAQVDSAPVSVKVRAVLVEYTDGNTESRSLQLSLAALASRLNVAYNAGTLIGNAITFKGSTLAAAISAIDGDTRFKYVAEPTMRVLDGESAKLTVGSEVPTRGAITTDKNGNAQQSIDYRTAGVVIQLEPRVLDGSISMKISQQISSFALTNTSNIDSPTILKREAQTTVSMKPGELVMLAGLDEERKSDSSSGLFFLPPFMRSTNSETSRSQLVLLLEAVPEI